MTAPSLLDEPSRVDEPRAVREYSEVLTQVASEGKAVIVRRNGTDLAAVIPVEHLELVREVLARQEVEAGVLEGEELTYPEAGTPQGGVISPLLANIYLHYVLDLWFTEVVKPRLKGRAFLVRYADDFVMRP